VTDKESSAFAPLQFKLLHPDMDMDVKVLDDTKGINGTSDTEPGDKVRSKSYIKAYIYLPGSTQNEIFEIVNYLESITSATGGTLLFLIVLFIFLSIVFVVAVLVDKIRMRLNDWILRLYSSLVR
jgi:hypothetical protein